MMSMTHDAIVIIGINYYEKRAIFNLLGALGTSDCYAPFPTISREAPSFSYLASFGSGGIFLQLFFLSLILLFRESFHYPPPVGLPSPDPAAKSPGKFEHGKPEWHLHGESERIKTIA
ncbi:hypothetical protein TNCV_1558741 [Trichonephila clavipes]|nr:hypothetical protein TNCV_1558741 [Trichonephila clavipes]